MEEMIMKKLIGCEFIFDTVWAEPRFSDGSMITIVNNMYQRSEADYAKMRRGFHYTLLAKCEN